MNKYTLSMVIIIATYMGMYNDTMFGFGFLKAVEKNDVPQVEQLVAEGVANPNERYGDYEIGYGNTPLINAVWNGNIEMIRALLKSNKIDVNAREGSYDSDDERTALLLAAERGREDIVRLLLADPRVLTNIKSLRESFFSTVRIFCGPSLGLESFFAQFSPSVIRAFGEMRPQEMNQMFLSAVSRGGLGLVRTLVCAFGNERFLDLGAAMRIVLKERPFNAVEILSALLEVPDIDVNQPLV